MQLGIKSVLIKCPISLRSIEVLTKPSSEINSLLKTNNANKKQLATNQNISSEFTVLSTFLAYHLRDGNALLSILKTGLIKPSLRP